MSEPFYYRHSGLLIASQIPLPEWNAFACDEGNADVHFVLSDDPCPDCPSDGSVAVGEVLRFAIDGIGGWQVEGGHTVRIHPSLISQPALLRLFTLGSAWGALGYQRGFAMWHGSAVEADGRATLFCGDTGAGKSTMAGGQCVKGANLVADDLSRIELSGGEAVIHPSSARIKLWSEAIDHFGWKARILERDYFRDEKFHCSVPAHCGGQQPVPLGAIVVLEEAEHPRLERISGAKALEMVFRATLYRPEMLDAMGLWASQGALAASVLAATPAWIWARPKKFGGDSFDLPYQTIYSARS